MKTNRMKYKVLYNQKLMTNLKVHVTVNLNHYPSSQRRWRRSGIFIVNFEHILHLVLVFLLFTLNMWLPAGMYLTNLESMPPTNSNEIIASPANIYLFKFSNRNVRARCGICSKLTIKTPERRQWRRSDVFINFEVVSHFFLVFLLLALHK